MDYIKGSGVNCSLSVSLGWQVLNSSSDSSYHDMELLGGLAHISSTVLKEFSQLSLLTMLCFILLSRQGVWKW